MEGAGPWYSNILCKNIGENCVSLISIFSGMFLTETLINARSVGRF